MSLNGPQRDINPLIHLSGRKKAARFVIPLVLLLPLLACSLFTPRSAGVPSNSIPGVPITGGGSSASPTPSAAAPLAGGALPSSAQTDAIKQVIQRANQEQQQALAAQNPQLMSDTATASYYQQLVQTYNDLLSSGVSAIQLDNLQWGPISLQDANTAQATTTETWTTRFSDGGTMQETDLNVYSLTRQNDAWIVQADDHPNAQPSQPPSGPSGAAPAPTVPAPSSPSGGQSSPSANWAGYNATNGTFTAVSGSWTVPNVSADQTAADATWVGIGGVTSRDLIQAGTDATVQGGQVVYTAWWETLPQTVQTTPLAVNPGDAISVAITQQANGTWRIVIQDQTTGGSYQKDVSYASSSSSAEWIEEAPSVGRRQMLPLDNFGTVSFTNATAVQDGQTRTIAQAGGQPISMAMRRQVLAQPSALGPDGASFTVTRTNGQTPVVPPSFQNAPIH
jgi:hypothetical protein